MGATLVVVDQEKKGLLTTEDRRKTVLVKRGRITEEHTSPVRREDSSQATEDEPLHADEPQQERADAGAEQEEVVAVQGAGGAPGRGTSTPSGEVSG